MDKIKSEFKRLVNIAITKLGVVNLVYDYGGGETGTVGVFNLFVSAVSLEQSPRPRRKDEPSLPMLCLV